LIFSSFADFLRVANIGIEAPAANAIVINNAFIPLFTVWLRTIE
jgi:hypothetical protein